MVKITQIQAEGFGVWNDLSIEDLSPDMTVFYGRNEAGKTTLMQFIRGVLYGYNEHRRTRYLPPLYGGLGGGSLQVLHGHESLQIERLDPTESSSEDGDLRVASTNGQEFGGEYLTRLLSGIDESIFTNVFALGLTEIQELNSLNGTEAAQELYKLASGVDRVSLVDVMKTLTKQQNALLEGSAGQLIQLFERHRELSRVVESCSQSGHRWVELMGERREIKSRLKSHKAKLSELELEARRLSVAQQVLPNYNLWKTRSTELEALSDLPAEQDVDPEKNSKLKKRLNDLEVQAGQLQGKAEDLKTEADDLPINASFQKNMSRIEAILEHQHWIQSLSRQSDRVKDEIIQLEQAEHSRSGLPNTLSVELPNVAITRTHMRQLAPFARQLKDSQRQLETAREQLAEAELELQELRDQLDRAMVENDCASLGESFQHTGQLVGMLRKRQGLDERVQQLNQQRKVAEVDLDDAIQDEVFSFQRLLGVGAFIVIGVALVLSGWSGTLINDMPYEPLLGFFGCGLVLAGLGLKKYWEHESRDEVDQAKQQFESVRDELEVVQAEREQLDQILPQGLGQGDGKLLDAQRRLAVLERLLPMEGRVTESTEQFEQAQAKADEAEAHQTEAELLWQEALVECGLPEALTPQQVRRLSEQSKELTHARERLSDAKQQLRQYQGDLAELEDRILDIYHDIDLEPEQDSTPATLLRGLESELKAQQLLIGERRSLAAKYKQLKKRWTTVKNRQQRLKLFRTQMYSRLGVGSEEEFLLLAAKIKRRSSLEHEVETIRQLVTSGISHPFNFEDIEAILEETTGRSLELDLEEVTQEIEGIRAEKEKGHMQEGMLTQQIKQLADDDHLDDSKLALKETEAEIQSAAQKWQDLTGTLLVLESLREFYEANRQPETLRRASVYLEQITGGRYKRLWTRMARAELLVDAAEENGVSIDVLSRGTREAVFLSLRLALVEAYHKRGIDLPMVLDDVLVNFDSERAVWAAEVLKNFAQQGHQVLMFSCHQHMATTFSEIGCDVRHLPHHRDVVHRPATTTSSASPQLMIESLSDEAEPESDHSLSELTEDSSLEALEEIEEVIEQELEDEAGAEYEDAEYEDAEYEDAEEELDEVECEETEWEEEEAEDVQNEAEETSEVDLKETQTTSATPSEPSLWEPPGLWWQEKTSN